MHSLLGSVLWLLVVLAAIPVTPGGLGVIEAVLIPSLIGFGNPTSVVAVGVVVYRLINFWLPIPVGLGAYVFIERHLAGAQPEGPKPVIEDLLDHQHRRQSTEPPTSTTPDDTSAHRSDRR